MRSQYLFLRRKGSDGYRRVLGRLRPDTAEFVRQGFLETRWYPLEIFLEIAAVADEELGDGDGELSRSFGRFACDQTLTTTHRLLFKFGDIGWLIDRAATAWREHFDEGTINVIERFGGRAILLQLDGVEQPDHNHCMAIQGWMERAAELSGEDRVHCEHRCRASGDVVCQWRFAWKRA